MKCPYRKYTEHIREANCRFVIHEYFAECHKEDCPFYIAQGKIGTTEYCGKAEKEMPND